MLPPPEPTLLISICGTRLTRPQIGVSPLRDTLPSFMSESVLVPPISNVIMSPSAH